MEEETKKELEDKALTDKLLKMVSSSTSFKEINSKILEISENEQDSVLAEKNLKQAKIDSQKLKDEKITSLTDKLWQNNKKVLAPESILENEASANLDQILDDHKRLKRKVDKVSKKANLKKSNITIVKQKFSEVKSKPEKAKKMENEEQKSLIGKSSKKKKPVKEDINNEKIFAHEKYYVVDNETEDMLNKFSGSYVEYNKREEKVSKKIKRFFKNKFNRIFDLLGDRFKSLILRLLFPIAPTIDKVLFSLTLISNKFFNSKIEMPKNFLTDLFRKIISGEEIIELDKLSETGEEIVELGKLLESSEQIHDEQSLEQEEWITRSDDDEYFIDEDIEEDEEDEIIYDESHFELGDEDQLDSNENIPEEKIYQLPEKEKEKILVEGSFNDISKYNIVFTDNYDIPLITINPYNSDKSNIEEEMIKNSVYSIKQIAYLSIEKRPPTKGYYKDKALYEILANVNERDVRLFLGFVRDNLSKNYSGKRLKFSQVFSNWVNGDYD